MLGAEEGATAYKDQAELENSKDVSLLNSAATSISDYIYEFVYIYVPTHSPLAVLKCSRSIHPAVFVFLLLSEAELDPSIPL